MQKKEKRKKQKKEEEGFILSINAMRGHPLQPGSPYSRLSRERLLVQTYRSEQYNAQYQYSAQYTAHAQYQRSA
eukprot:1258197-Rhodomonas_salina.1